MILAVEWVPQARRDLKKLDPSVRRRIIEAVERLASTGQGDVRHLTAVEPREYRLRVGSWRVRFTRDEGRRLLSVLRVLPRGKAYR